MSKDAAQAVQEEADLTAGRRVLEIESRALAEMSAALDVQFTAALDILMGVTGRVIVTGMGKSGHVARKIASTLASTGTPAQYVHPGEASHGDLGMIAPGDAIIALSNSGATPELADIVAYSRRRSIPLIAITKRAGGTLGEAADVTLLLVQAPEACPMGLAPTTSTTLMMALGDALATSLLARKGFTADGFRALHPGGALANQLLRVGDLMHGVAELPLCAGDAPLSDAILVMTERTFGCVGVVGPKGGLEGIITDGDLRRHMGPDLLQCRAAEIMSANPKTIRSQALAAEALGVMNGLSITCLFVVDDDRPLGIVRMHDCLRANV